MTRLTVHRAVTSTKPWARTRRRRPQLKEIFWHIIIIFAKSLLKVDYSEESPQGRIPLRIFWDKFHGIPLETQGALPPQSFHFSAGKFPENVEIFMSSRYFLFVWDRSGSVQGPSQGRRDEFWSSFECSRDLTFHRAVTRS